MNFAKYAAMESFTATPRYAIAAKPKAITNIREGKTNATQREKAKVSMPGTDREAN
jgi:hypothetical protein